MNYATINEIRLFSTLVRHLMTQNIQHNTEPETEQVLAIYNSWPERYLCQGMDDVSWVLMFIRHVFSVAESFWLIKSIEPTEGGAKVVLESRDKAIEMFCKMHGLTKDTINITTSEQLSDVMNQLSGGVVFDEPDDNDETDTNKYGF